MLLTQRLLCDNRTCFDDYGMLFCFYLNRGGGEESVCFVETISRLGSAFLLSLCKLLFSLIRLFQNYSGSTHMDGTG